MHALFHPPSSLLRSLSLPSGVIPAVDRLEARLVDMGVDLRGGDVAVAQQFLDDAQVGPAAQQVGGKAVPQHVG